MSKKLLIIDPQNDFMDFPFVPGSTRPTLPVEGASADMTRLAGFVRTNTAAIESIMVTLDSHNVVDIAHRYWWVDAKGNHPQSFTVISAEDVRSGVWSAAFKDKQESSLEYVTKLEAAGRQKLVIWPVHCLIGSWGHNIHAGLKAALNDWEIKTGKTVEYVFKGMNPGTEHYSAVQAEVVDELDPGTEANDQIIDFVNESSVTYVAGEALSHCVANTVKDLIAYVDASKMVLLTDCMSPVTGFEQLGEEFKANAFAEGVAYATSEDSV